ncbi:MAG: endonuclease/exonuclease/phosphatase family protein [Gemmatimonadaceae bacterium]|nr:endonuclease/exonuclease/phosphatase family protein [Gemmatimonadaceae bacterium]
MSTRGDRGMSTRGPRTRLGMYGALAVALFGAPRVADAQAPVRVLTFNIRYGTANDGAHRWPFRRPHVIATIRDHHPHLLGVQEALRAQLDDIESALPGFRELGVGRDDGATGGEYSALLVDTARFVVADHGQFWFSDRPAEPGSMTWGNGYPRVCVWARLVDRATGDTLLVFNQHWDHESQPSRERSAALLLARMADAGAGRLPALVLGDFNSGESNAAFRALLSDRAVRLRDTFRELAPTAGVVGTLHAFKGDSTGEKIDAILATPQWTVLDASIDRRRFGDLWASDHFAVAAVLRRR